MPTSPTPRAGSDALPELQRHGTGAAARSRRPATPRPTPARPVRAAARRRVRDQQPRRSAYRGLTLGVAQALVAAVSVRSQLRAVEGRRRRLERARSVHRSDLQFLRPEPRLRARPIATSGTASTSSPTPSCRSGFLINVRVQARSRSRSPPSPRVLNGDDRGRNWDRKDNKYFSLDWRLQRSLPRSADATTSFPVSRCSTPSTTPTTSTRCRRVALFNFDGFLRQGVGDPRQVQLAVKVAF